MKPITLLTLLLMSRSCLASLIIAISSPPAAEPYRAASHIVAASIEDKMPNPCFGDRNCELRFVMLDKKWDVNNQSEHSSHDYGWFEYAGVSDHDQSYKFRTMGEWWAAVPLKNRGISGYDYDDRHQIHKPCMALAGMRISDRQSIPGTLVSNCADAYVAMPTCSLTPNHVNITLTTAQGVNVPDTDGGTVQISCTQSTSLTVRTNEEEKIPLGGEVNSYAQLDWGAGYGVPRALRVEKNVPTTLAVRVKTVGLANLHAGVVSGTAVVNLTYN
ncbi:Uncharacterised protein [Serratia proteamaculans]|uniref:hypothetical protein n=1 Tax=Serratia proteamaculans TaxID=28151 RepID=UPI001249EE25|nr:hypothetical protein [Serratia proteamaculans]KAB1496709.1 hypothetical protein F8R23_10970 [Serratia proteamaculans]CAI0929010.1 Uncharacterised protein [Serratia proteamaculans]CAI0933205.1 Uncharacterised protein [Serratia proteamaculans]